MTKSAESAGDGGRPARAAELAPSSNGHQPEPELERAVVPNPRRRVIVASLMLAMFLAAMEVTVVATAMPSIVSRLGGFSEFTWVFSIFLLAQTATIPIYGRLADLYGRRPVFAAGTGLFLLGSLLCGAAGSMTQLILFRAVQGVGAGAVQPIASTIIGDLFSLRERARLQGWLSSVWAISSVVGPLVGGFIIDHLEWHWIFWINLPFGLLAVMGVVLFLREPVGRTRHAIDYGGAVLLVVGVTMLLLALLEGGTAWAWTSAQSLGLLAGAAVVLAGFILREMRAAEPILPLELFRNRVVAASDAGALLIGGLTLSITSFIPLFVQGTLGETATTAGLTLASLSIGWPIASVLAGRLMLVSGYRWTALLGAALCVVATALLAFGPRPMSLLWLAVALCVMGAGLGFSNTTLIVAIQGAVSWSQRGVATASSMFSRQLGSTLWVAVLGSTLNAVLLARLAAVPPSELAAAGKDGLGVTSLLLDVQARAALAPGLLQQLQAALGDAVHAVFLGLLATAVLAVLMACLLPGGAAQDRHATAPLAPEPEEAAASR